MTTTQSFKIYEVLQRHFKNNDENKITILTTKEDLLKFQVDVEKRFNSMILWVVGTGIGVVGLILSTIKLFIIK